MNFNKSDHLAHITTCQSPPFHLIMFEDLIIIIATAASMFLLGLLVGMGLSRNSEKDISE